MKPDPIKTTLAHLLQLSGIYSSMKSRCTNKRHPFFRFYGGRGVKMCRMWKQSKMHFILFCLRNGWKPGLECERKNNNLGYYPSNLTFVKHARNLCNRMHGDGSKGFSGRRYSKLPLNVSMHYGKLRVVVTRGGRRIGKYFKTVKAAIRGRDKIIRQLERQVYGANGR